MATTKKRTLSALVITFVLTLICSFCMTIFSVNASETPINVHVDSSAITASFGQTFTHDTGKTGLRLRSVKSGTAAEGTSFTVGDTMTGDFEMDFRVTSQETYRLKEGSSGGWSHSISAGQSYNNIMADDMNPFLDLKEVAFTFTSATDTSKYFTVFVRGTCSVGVGQAFNTSAYVYIPGDANITSAGKGYGLPVGEEGKQTTDAKWSSNTTTIGGTSFSNYTSLSSATAAGGVSTSNLVKFDAENMKVYVNANNAGNNYATNNTTANILVRDLATNAGFNLNATVGALSASDFANGYTVKVEYTDVTDNATVGNSANLANISGPGQYATLSEAYERYADMTIYSLNGVAFTEENVNLVDGKSDRKHSTYVSDLTSGLQLTENKQNKVDTTRKGLNITSTVSGTAAEGQGFSFADTMTGDFELDFRVTSQETYRLKEGSSGGWSHSISAGQSYNNIMADDMNPFLDLKEVAFTFTSVTDTSKYFTVFVRGTCSVGTSQAFNTSAYVYIPGDANITSAGKGYGLPVGEEGSQTTATKWSSNTTLIGGTSFSNYTSLSSATAAGGVSTSNLVKFDAENMKVYVNANNAGNNYATNNTTANILVRDLATNAGFTLNATVGALSASDFANGYTVKVEYTDVTDNATVGNSALTGISGASQYATLSEAYDRYIDMTIYSLNGVDLTYVEGTEKTSVDTKPVLSAPALTLTKGVEADLTPLYYDAADGNTPAQYGTVSVSADNGESWTAVVKNGENKYLFTPLEKGEYLVKYEGFANKRAVAANTVTTGATCTAIEYTLTLKVGESTQSIVKEKGEQVALKELVSLEEGYVVIGYKIEGKEGLYSPEYALTLNENTTVEAVSAYFSMIDSASIRYAADGTNGIRFGVKLDEASKAAIEGLTNVTYYYSMTLVGGNTVIKEVEASSIYFDETLNAYVATAAVINLPSSMFADKWTAQFYVVADYADKTEVQTNAYSYGTSYSIQEVAQAIKNGDQYEALSAEKKELIDSFIGEEVQA